MRLFTIAVLIGILTLFGVDNMRSVYAQEKAEWIKYLTWEGDIDDMIIFRVEEEMIKADYPVASGYRNAKVTFYASDPNINCATKVEVEEGRGSVAISKQFWQPPQSYIKIQVFDQPKGYGHYKFTIYYLEKKFTPQEKASYQKLVNKAVYEFDVYQLNRELAKENLPDALRWARSAYEIDRLNWEMLNIIGAIYYRMNAMEKAEDVFVILRDYGYLTEENKKRFKEIAPFEYSKLEEKEKEEGKPEEGEEGEGEEGSGTEQQPDEGEQSQG